MDPSASIFRPGSARPTPPTSGLYKLIALAAAALLTAVALPFAALGAGRADGQLAGAPEHTARSGIESGAQPSTQSGTNDGQRPSSAVAAGQNLTIQQNIQNPTPKTQKIAADYGKLPLAFEVNAGQTDAQAKFLARGAGYTLFLTGDEAVLSLKKAGARSQDSGGKGESRPLSVVSGPLRPGPSGHSSFVTRHSLSATDNGPRTTDSILRMKLLGANPDAWASGLDELPGKSNYFIGNDPKKWRTNVANYGQVKYSSVYPGIDLVYYGNQGRLEYDFVVAPGADPGAITLQVAAGSSRQRRNGGVKPPLRIDRNGDLVVRTNGGEVRFQKPVIYQPSTTAPVSSLVTRHSSLVNGRYRLRRHQVTFEVTKYDRTRPLVIDPALAYSTYIGGSGGDAAYAIAVDGSGNAYVTGYTDSTDFPITPGAFQPNNAGPFGNDGPYAEGDAFVTKLNSAGSALAYSTYLGGSAGDFGTGIAVDASGDAFVTGITASDDFPVTPGAFQTTCGDCNPSTGHAAFVAALSPGGSSLIYSTFLSGNLLEFSAGVALDSSGDAYVTGYTTSDMFPTTPGAFDSCTMTNGSAAYITKFNPTGSALVYSTCLPGAGNIGNAAVDASGDAYIVGSTGSVLPTTPGAFQTTYGGGEEDGFVTKLNPSGTALVYSTFLGGSSDDQAYGIALDASGDAYVTGSTISSNFPTTPGAYETTCSTCFGAYNYFVTELNPTGSALVYSTYLDSSGTAYEPPPGEIGPNITLDASGDAWVTGDTSSNTSYAFPTTPGAFQTASCEICIFVAELNPAGSALIYSTYLNAARGSVGIARDALGNLYVTGAADGGFPTTPGAFQSACVGPCFDEAFVTKFVPGDQVWPLALGFGSQNVGVSNTQTTTLSNSESTALSITGVSLTGASDFTEINTCGSTLAAGASCSVTVTFNPSAVGSRTATLNITDSAANSPQTVALSGTGVGVPMVGTSPSSLAFGSQLVGTTSSAQTATLTNPGTASVSITSIGASAGFGETNTCGSSLAVGASCTISVTFVPAASGSQTGAVTIADNVSGSPQIVSVSGTGVAPVATLASTSLTFASQTVGTTSAPQTITLTNSGTAALAISSIGALGDFGVTNNCGTSLAAGASCSLAVVFTPQNTGMRSGSLTLTDSAAGSPQTVALTGTGVAPAVSLSPASLTFANQLVGSASGAQTVSLTNAGNGTLTIGAITASGDFSQTNTCPTSLAAGGNCAISVVFTPSATGARTAALSISDNAAGSPQIVALTGTGVAPTASLSPSGLTFPALLVGTTSTPQTILVTNNGTASLVVTGVAASGDFAETNTCGAPVSAGASCTISATLTPTASGTRTGLVTITDNVPGGPQVVALSGVGLTGPIASFSPTSLSFPSQLLGASSLPQTITLTNTGGTALSVTSVVSSSAEYGVLNSCGSTVAAGSSCAIGVFFDPSASGSQNGTLTITDNAPGGHQTVALSGAGMDFQLSAPSPAATVAPGGSVSYGVFLVPVAGFNQTVSLACSGAPAEASCSVSPSSVAAGGSSPVSVAVNVTTTGASASPGLLRWYSRPGSGRPGSGAFPWPSAPKSAVWFLVLVLAMLAALALCRRGRRGTGFARWASLMGAPAALLLLVMILASGACGGGTMAITNAGTPPGSYNLTVTGNFKSGATALTHTVTLQLTVR